MAAASASPNQPADTFARCGAKTRAGTPCAYPAGRGTDHLGYGKCKHHGGNSPSGTIAGARQMAIALGAELDLEPHEALLLTVRRAAMWERICASKVAALTDDQLIVTHVRERVWAGNGENGTGGGTETITGLTRAELHIWLRAHQQAIRDLASIAKTALDAGVEERRVRVVESLGGQLADLIGGILADLKLDEAQKVIASESVRRHLTLIEGGQAAA